MTQASPEEKQALRKAMFAKRKQAHAEQAASASTAVIEPVLQLIDDWLLEQGRASCVVSGYWPIRTELDPRALIAAIQHQGHQLVLPVVPGPDVRLVFRQHTDARDLVEGEFGAFTPPETAQVMEPDVLICPLLAFDEQGYRLGYGGGYYDRSIEDIKRAKPIFTIGLAYAEQLVDQVPIEPTDQRLDALVTPNRFWHW